MPEPAFVDVVDESDNRVGQIALEEASKSKDKITRAIAVFVFNSRREIFLQKRPKTDSNNPLCWSCSVSGPVYSEESYLEAATRQIQEIIRIRIEPYDLEFLDKIFLKEETPQFFHVYRISWDGLIKTNSPEAESGRFFSVQEIKDMIAKGEKFSPSFLALFKLFLAGIN